jgi:hypothetical protein
MKHEEDQHQQYLFSWFNIKYLHLKGMMFHIPNGQNVGMRAGARLKRAGLTAGIPDILLSIPTQDAKGEWIHGMYIEMKSANGRNSPAQCKMQAMLKAVGYRVEVCKNWHDARTVIDDYLSTYTS